MLLYRAYGGEMTRYYMQRTIFDETIQERVRQDIKFGEQSYKLAPHDMTNEECKNLRKLAQEECEKNAKDGTLSWADIILEEFYEACAETNIELQYKELLQMHAVTLHALEDLKYKIEQKIEVN